jgi:hypothetical protein
MSLRKLLTSKLPLMNLSPFLRLNPKKKPKTGTKMKKVKLKRMGTKKEIRRMRRVRLKKEKLKKEEMKEKRSKKRSRKVRKMILKTFNFYYLVLFIFYEKI